MSGGELSVYAPVSRVQCVGGVMDGGKTSHLSRLHVSQNPRTLTNRNRAEGPK